MAYDYDEGEVTPRERQAANNQTALAQQQIKDIKNQLARQLANYDFADAQNRALADTQLKQNSRKTSADRFEAQRNLQNATLGLLGTMGSAMNGSTTGNLMHMLEGRNDSDNNTYWAQHQVNQDAVENAYNDSLNQNRVARKDAIQSAEKAIRDTAADWSANMNNINPAFFNLDAPGNAAHPKNDSMYSASVIRENPIEQNNAQVSGYLIPDNAGGPTDNTMNVGSRRNQVGGEDYFSRLMNRFNGVPQRTPENAARYTRSELNSGRW